MTHITVNKISKKYSTKGFFFDKKTVLNNVSFTLNDGDKLGIIGPNGAGKTTLLQILAGISKPSSGAIKVEGQVTAVFTLGYGLRDDLTGRENIFIDCEIQGYNKKQVFTLLPEIINFAGLGEFIDRPMRTYSTGMKARLAFSMLVHIKPEILILDETLSVGDAQFAVKARKKMEELSNKGKILILVSHSMTSIREMCNRCIWLDNGHIIMDGDPDDVTDAYLNKTKIHMYENINKINKINNIKFNNTYGIYIDEISNFKTHNDAYIKVEINIPGQKVNIDTECLIYRSDGLRLNSSYFKGILMHKNPNINGYYSVKVIFKCLPLNYGLYKFIINLIDNNKRVAKCESFIEVINPLPHSGGKPIIVPPIKFSSEKIV